MEFWSLSQSPLITGASLGACCLSLLAELPSKVFLPGTGGFNSSLSSYYSQQESSLQPLCIIKPDTVADVSSAIKIISLAADSLEGEDEHQCHFAVRSGGHGINAGAANVAGGVTIDLSSLDSFDLRGKTASVGSGSTWDQVYSKLEPFGLSVAGGRNAGVGLGGLTTGGGISFFSPRYGWTCDSVVNYEVVLSNGTIVNASAEENPELLFALRGGSNNFGVVTRIDLQTFEQGKIWGGLNYYDLSTKDDHLKAFYDLNSADNYDEYSSLITSFLLAAGKPPAIATNMEYTKPEEKPPALHALASIPVLYSTMRIAGMTELALELISVQPYGLRQLYVQSTHLSTLPMLNATFVRWNESLPAIQDIPGIAWTLSLEPLPPSIYARAAGSNTLGLADRSGSLVITLLTATWTSAADDVRVTAAARGLIASIEDDGRKLGAYDEFVYLNYAAPWQDPIATYGVENVDRLKRVQREVDPRGLFTRNVPGGFKIPA